MLLLGVGIGDRAGSTFTALKSVSEHALVLDNRILPHFFNGLNVAIVMNKITGSLKSLQI